MRERRGSWGKVLRVDLTRCTISTDLWMGGAMSHGAVVAREYSLPVVVGVPGATTRIATGARLRVDGTAGTIKLLEPRA